MNQPEMNERGIGDNNPPPVYSAAEYNQHVIAVNKLIDSAEAMFTGVQVENEEQYGMVKALQDELKTERLATDRQRKIDKQPFLDTNARIESDYKALLNKLTAAENAGKSCVEQYLQKLEQERQEAARIAREAKEKAEQELRDAHAAKEGADLDEELRIQEKEAQAKEAAKASGKVNKKQATGLKTVYTPTITDKVKVIKHYWSNPALMETLMTLIKSDIRSGKREIPGVEIKEERVAR